ncbi:hypothetical protein D9M71_231280 [compost metagenome]
MPAKLKPGTPSMLAGSRMPCQWIEVSSFRRLRTRRVTTSPSRQRSSGAGRLPLTATAVRVLPVKLTGSSSMLRSNCVPASTPGCPGLPSAHTGARHRPRPASTPPAAKPLMKVRREVTDCMLFMSSQSKAARAEPPHALRPRAELLWYGCTIKVASCREAEVEITVLSGWIGGRREPWIVGRRMLRSTAPALLAGRAKARLLLAGSLDR